jgi:type 1 glutamine amidotransferase
VSDELSNFDPDKIGQYSAIVFLNTTGEIPFTDAEKKALTDAVSSGKVGFVGIHSATDTLYQWPAYGEMIGGHFDGHPWTADTTVTIRKEEENAVTKPFAQQFQLTEEIYQMKEYDRSKCDVCMSLDTTKTDMTRKGIKRTDGDFPVSWVKTYGKAGRVFYTSMGHNDATYEREDYQKHVLAGLRWVMGDFDMDVKSHPLPAGGK